MFRGCLASALPCFPSSAALATLLWIEMCIRWPWTWRLLNMSSSLPGANRRQEMGCFQVRQGGLVSLNRLHAGYKKVYGKRYNSVVGLGKENQESRNPALSSTADSFCLASTCIRLSEAAWLWLIQGGSGTRYPKSSLTILYDGWKRLLVLECTRGHDGVYVHVWVWSLPSCMPIWTKGPYL